jgi:hypothetical protein
VQHAADEARVQQMQHGVLDAADVDVDVARALRIDHVVRVARVGVAQPVPRRVDKRVHCVALALGGAAALGARAPRSQAANSGDAVSRGASGTGSADSGSTCGPHALQCTAGIGVPHARCREISQSRRRNWRCARPTPSAASRSVMAAAALASPAPSTGGETRSACAAANAASRSSCAGTPITAPVPTSPST